MADDFGIQRGMGGFASALGTYADIKRQRALEEKLAKQQEFQNNLSMREIALKERALSARPNQAGSASALTPGRKAADMAFGKDYVDWSTQGFASAQKGLQALKEAQAALASGSNISGGFVGQFPDRLRTITNPKAIAVKENIRGAVMNTLRATLGAQFTEKEGERIFNLAYNDQLPEAENLARLKRITDELESMTQAKQSLADYFEQTGTATGWQGRMPVVGADAQPAVPAQGGSDIRSRLARLRGQK